MPSPTLIADNHLRHDTPARHILVRLTYFLLSRGESEEGDKREEVKGKADEVLVLG